MSEDSETEKSVVTLVKSDGEEAELPAKKSLSDEGYNSPNRKNETLHAPMNYLSSISRFPPIVQNSAFTNLQLMKTASLLQSNHFYPQVPAFYSMLPFLNPHNSQNTQFFMGESQRKVDHSKYYCVRKIIQNL